MPTHSRGGPVNRSIVVSTNDPTQRQFNLYCLGKVLIPFSRSISSLSFGAIGSEAGPQKRTIPIMRGDGGPIAPTVITPIPSGMEAIVREIKPGERYELEVTLQPPWTAGPFHGLLTLSTGVPEAPKETVRVSANIMAARRAPVSILQPKPVAVDP